jgi:hypothetical protein
LVIYRTFERGDTPATRSAALRICVLAERAPRLFEIDPWTISRIDGRVSASR